MPKEILGTPNYMSPEMFEPSSHGGVGPECDIWGGACVLVEMLSGRVPWEGKQHGAVRQAVCQLRQTPLSLLPDGLPHPLRSLLEKCFSFHPRDRPRISAIVAGLGGLLIRGASAAASCSLTARILKPDGTYLAT